MKLLLGKTNNGLVYILYASGMSTISVVCFNSFNWGNRRFSVSNLQLHTSKTTHNTLLTLRSLTVKGKEDEKHILLLHYTESPYVNVSIIIVSAWLV